MLAFLLNIPALAITHLLLPHDLYYYQGQYIYHPAFLVPRLSVWLMGLGGLLLVYRFVRERMGSAAALRAALIYAALPTTVIFSADLHQDVPLCFFLIPYFYFLWKRRLVWAGVFWGLAFATKNQAIFALGPIFAEGIWNFFHVQGSERRWVPLLDAARTCAIVFFLGVVVSAPFGNPVGNLAEVIKTSDPDIESLNSAMHLYYRMPLWIGVSMLAFLALHLLEDAKDSYDRMQLAWLLIPVFFYFVHNYRTYMLVPSVAILVGSYFEARSMRLVLGFLLALNAMALRSPYMTARHLIYPSLNQPGAPNTIEGIERLSGIGAIQSETSDPNSPKRPQQSPRLESPR